jgi:hypothetical protein
MRPASVEWERAAEVHEAAEGWLRSGDIDEATAAAARAAYPDPCVTPSAAWRVLTACVVAAVTFSAFGACAVAFDPRTTGLEVMFFLFADALVVAAELLEASPRFARRGAAGAASFLGVGFFVVCFGIFAFETMRLRSDDGNDAILAVSALAWAAACWRWGSPFFAAFSAVSLFLFLGQMGHGRVLWILVGTMLVALAARRLDAASCAPSHRRAAAILVAAGIAAVYAAVNVYSLQMHLVEDLKILVRFSGRDYAPSPGLMMLSALATALFPLAVLAWGLLSRRTFLLDTGIVLVALSLVTLRHYVHIAPLWVVLTVSGAALVVVALAIERALRRAPAGEIAGFTAAPLFSDERRRRALGIVPVVATFAPAAPASAAQDKDFTGGGGTFGGGGATEKF